MQLTDGLRDTARLHKATSESAIAGLHAAASRIVDYRKFLREINADLSECGEAYTPAIIESVRARIVTFLEDNR